MKIKHEHRKMCLIVVATLVRSAASSRTYPQTKFLSAKLAHFNEIYIFNFQYILSSTLLLREMNCLEPPFSVPTAAKRPENSWPAWSVLQDLIVVCVATPCCFYWWFFSGPFGAMNFTPTLPLPPLRGQKNFSSFQRFLNVLEHARFFK